MCNTRKLGLRSTNAAANAVLFSLALPFFSSYAPNAHALGRTANLNVDLHNNWPMTPLVDKAPNKKVKKCKVNDKKVEYEFPGGITKAAPISLSEGEEIEESACTGDKGFVRTNKRIYVTTADDDGTAWYTPWFDISGAHKTGIVAWTQSYDACYILTKDGKLTPIYVDDIGKNDGRLEYTIPPSVDGARMIEFGGVVFIAFNEKILAFRFNKKDSVPLLIAPYPGAKFSITDNRLYYGREGGKITEIKVEKEEISYPLDLGR